MLTKRMLPAITLLLLSAPVIPAAPASGASGATQCTFEHEVVASPGLSTSPTSGTITTNGETGTFACDGPVNGKQPTGTGTSGSEGRYGTRGGDTCQSGGEGDAVRSMTIPTAGGPERIKNTVTYEFGAFKAGAPFSARFTGDRMSGTMEVTPIDGDCASKPVTRYRVTGKGTLKG
jgi:hypothetical protein